MKGHFLKALSGRFLIALLIAFTAFAVHSCRKGADVSDQQIKAELTAQHFPVSVAKEWFDSKTSTFKTKLKINAQGATALALLTDFTPVWDSARTTVDTNYYVVEAPAKYLRKLGFKVDDQGNHISGTTRLLVMKYKKTGSVRAVLMHIRGDVGVATTNVHYMDVPQTFSGNIFYTTVQGASVCGYIYEQGVITKVQSGSASIVQPALQTQVALAPGECETISTDWYEQTCNYTADGNLINCTDWTYVYTTQYTYCAPTPGPGGGGGGGVGPPGDCGGGGGTVASVKGKLVIQVEYGGGGGGGEDPCVPPVDIINQVENPCLKKMIDSVINANLKGKVNSMIQSVFHGTGSLDLTFTDQIAMIRPSDDAEEVGIYDPLDPTNMTGASIRLDPAKLATSSREYIAATIMHEALHAYLDHEGIPIDDPQHVEMANKYVNTMAADLMAMFPGMVPDTAYSLAWAGLENTPAYSDPKIRTAPMPQYQKEINLLLRAHKVDGKTYGHGCL